MRKDILSEESEISQLAADLANFFQNPITAISQLVSGISDLIAKESDIESCNFDELASDNESLSTTE
jgi:hypothetical protein